MKTIIEYKVDEGQPEVILEHEDVAPSFDFEEDHVELIDYELRVVSEKPIPLNAIKRIIWTEE